MRLLHDGMPTKTFSLQTLPPPELASDSERVDKLKKVSRQRYNRDIADIKEKISRWRQSDRQKAKSESEKTEAKKKESKSKTKK